MHNFGNSASYVGFIGNYSSIEEVIAADEKELQEMGGSFEAIADRLRSILSYAEKNCYDRQKFLEFDEKIKILFYDVTKGSQECPFSGCEMNWCDVVGIQNLITGRKLTINGGIEHLVRKHNLLEKGNGYEITAKELYEHFM